MKNVLVTLQASDAFKAQLNALSNDYTFTFASEKDLTPESMKDVQVLIGNIDVNLVKAAKNLEWLQLNSAGFEPYVEEGVVPAGAYVCNAAGAYGPTVSEHLIAMILTMVKKIHLYRDSQRDEDWTDHGGVLSFCGLTVLVLGLGDIGRHAAQTMKALGNTVIGIRRNTNNKPDYVDELHTMAELDDLLPQADIVVSSLPGGPQTEKLIGAHQFDLMKETAYFFNVGRGTLVDTDALVEAVQQKKIAGAGLDVIDPEPLPKGHPAWKEPNLLITPHVSGGFHMPGTLEYIYNLIIENLKRFSKGEKPNRIVN